LEVLTLEEFRAYAIFGTALGTAGLALATFYMASKTSQQMEVTRLSLEKPVIGEMIVNAIEPVEKRIEQDADAIESGEGLYLYDIPMPHLPPTRIPRTLYDMKTIFLGDIFGLYPHYWELIRRYPDLKNYLAKYAESIKEARRLVEQTLEDIKTYMGASSLAEVVTTFPSNYRIPLKYLPFWELLAASGRTVPRPDYDRFDLWMPEVQSFWQNHKEEVMAIVHTDEGLTAAVIDINKTFKECENILVAKFKRLNNVKRELIDKYLFTDKELEMLRTQDKGDSSDHPDSVR